MKYSKKRRGGGGEKNKKNLDVNDEKYQVNQLSSQ